MQKDLFTLIPGQLSLQEIQYLLSNPIKLDLSADARASIAKGQEVVAQVLEQDAVVYGINTGFGLLANTRISNQDLAELQRKILLSHAVGVGEYLPTGIVKLIMLLKINSLARGYSGVRQAPINLLLKLYNAEIYPCIPAKGSVGASGDLAPLAHLTLPLIGEGNAIHHNKIISGQEALALVGEQPLTLAPKEGLAFINGTQVSCAIALYHYFRAQELFNAAITIGALSVDAAMGSHNPFDARIHAARGQRGQIKVAAAFRDLLADSEIVLAHKNCNRVQDPYCLRCQPQVMGACLDSLLHAGDILALEANAVTDNPLVFPDTAAILSGGNFHAEPVAQVADFMAIALAEIGALSERRIALLVDPHFNYQLPAFLVPNPGLNSGFMIAHVTAAALASANKSLAHPASVDSIPTSANQEDHVSMATQAAWRLRDMLENVTYILAIEYLAAAQGLDLREPLHTSPCLIAAYGILRQRVSFLAEDRYIKTDIEEAAKLVPTLGRQLQTHFFSEKKQYADVG